MKKKSNVFWMIASLLIAVILWGYVVAQVNPSIKRTISGVPVQILNADSLAAQDRILTTRDFTVSVVLSGDRSNIGSIRPEDIVATMNVAGYGEGTSTAQISVFAPPATEVREVRPSNVDVTVERLQTKEIKTQVGFTGTLPVGYEIGFLNLSPESVTIVGPETAVSRVEEARITLEVGNITQNGYSFTIVPTLYSSAMTEVSGLSSVSTVQGNVYLCETQNVGLEADLLPGADVPEGYKMTVTAPETIKVRSAKQNLAQLGTIRSTAVTVPFSEEPTTVTLDLLLPDDVEPAEGYQTIQATVRFEAITQ